MALPPLLFIHGLWGRPQNWTALADHFRARGAMVLTPALPWHDRDPQEPPIALLGQTSLHDYVTAMEEVARTLPAPPVVIGHSAGAVIAQKLAERLPVAGLALLAPAPSAGIFGLSASVLRALAGIMITPSWWKSPVRMDEVRARLAVFNAVPAAEADAELAQWQWESGRALFELLMPWADRQHGARVAFEKLLAPALVMVGDQDQLTPVRVARATARRMLGQVDYREIAGAGHWLFAESVHGEVVRELEHFLRQIG